MTCTGIMTNLITSNFPMAFAYREPVVSNQNNAIGADNPIARDASRTLLRQRAKG